MRNFDLQEAVRKKRILPFSDGPKVAPKEGAEKNIEAAEKAIKQAQKLIKK